MRLLLDTHIFIWWADEPERLSPFILNALMDEENDLLLSVVSLWEMQIKTQLGKLAMSRPLDHLVSLQQSVNELELLPVLAHHVFALDELPLLHKDPFDRMIIAQSQIEKMTIVTVDKAFRAYEVALLGRM
jgi:PIN domain nuclease of toxin-antitoxin system